jgi:sterol desaturase/sphingolipid hydroxylase (fatty acid hydroxylase superfamily)
MELSRWLLVHGEAAQYGVFFGLFTFLAVVERRRPFRPLGPQRLPRWPANGMLTALNVVVLGALPVSFLGMARFAEANGIGLLHAVALPGPALVLANLTGRGLISWVTHLLMHKVPLFWRIHRVHHLDTELDVSTTVRFHPLEFPIALAVGLPLVLALGLTPWLLVLYEVGDVAVTLFSHANVDLPGPIERLVRLVVVTPGLHRVHHSTRPEETDSNFGAVFPIWDQVFGTYRTATREPPREMAIGLAEVRDARSRSILWLLGVPLLSRLDAAGLGRRAQESR